MWKYVEPADTEAYEAFVGRHPKGHFLQSLKWAEFKGGNRAAVVSLDGDGSIRGAMSIFLQDAPLFGAKLLYSPRGPVCAPDDLEAMQELCAGAKALAEKQKGYALTIDPDITEQDAQFLRNLEACGFRRGDNGKDNAILQPLAVFRIDVGGKSEEELLASFHSKARYSVRSALKGNAVCRIGGADELPAFQRLLVETAGRDGFTPRPLAYFERMFQVLPEEMCKLFVVELDGEIIAGSVLIRYGDKTWHLYGASDDAHNKALPNFLMQWAMMRWTINQGLHIYDMRGVAGEGDKTKPLEGLMRFKKRFGGELIPFVGRLDLVYRPAIKRAIDTARAAKRRLRGQPSAGKGPGKQL